MQDQRARRFPAATALRGNIEADPDGEPDRVSQSAAAGACSRTGSLADRASDGAHHARSQAVLPLCYHNAMAIRKKRSISMPPDLDAEIAAAAEQAGMSYSAWLADTARKEFTIRAGLAAVSEFEREHGAFTPGELAEAEEWAAGAVERARRTGSSPRRRTA
jgi:hypothetical protein